MVASLESVSSVEKPAPKRQKIVAIDENGALDYDANKNANLKGRRRFNADLSDLQDASAQGLVLNGLRVKSKRCFFWLRRRCGLMKLPRGQTWRR